VATVQGIERCSVSPWSDSSFANHAPRHDPSLPRPWELPPGFEFPRPINVTFIPAKVFDNPALLRVNPDYPTTRSPSALCWWTAYKDDSQMPAARVRCDLIGGLAGFRQLRRYGQGRGDRSRRKPRSAASSAAARST